jgi:hypothetical protein
MFKNHLKTSQINFNGFSESYGPYPFQTIAIQLFDGFGHILLTIQIVVSRLFFIINKTRFSSFAIFGE